VKWKKMVSMSWHCSWMFTLNDLIRGASPC
jgi:hypothetical protein